MRGFRQRSTVATALDWIDDRASPLGSESVPLVEAYDRVLAGDAIADIDVPAFDRSAMDGYALRADEAQGASDYGPLEFRVVGESLPGRPFPGETTPGSAVRIMTGAPVPSGATGVVPAEYTTESGGVVAVTSAVPVGKHIGLRGEDVRAGTTLLPAGCRLRPQDVGLLASVGLAHVDVVRRPRVRLIVTGNELVRPGDARGEFQIYEANSYVLRSLVGRDGALLESQRDVPDERDAIRAALVEPGADVLLVSGGSSVGREDHAPSLVAEVGELSIHGVAMRPSSPAGLGHIGESLVFLLPGNPVSCLCAYEFFAGRAIRRLGGRSAVWPFPARKGRLTRKIASAIGRTDFCRVRIDGDDVQPLALAGASILSSTVRANGFVVVPAEREGHPPGETVTVHVWG